MKKIVRKFLSYFGYDFIKITPKPFLKKEYEVRIGNYTLTMPSINPLIDVYRNKKDFASEIGRITLCVHEKYTQLRFIDVGANTGDTAAIIKSVINIPLICIEGDPFSFSYLKRNVEQLSDVTIFNNYLGEKEDTLEIVEEKAGWNTTLIPSPKKGRKITLTTLDNLLYQNFKDLKNFKLLKIDTEGFDTIILRGSENFILNNKPVIYIEYNRDNMSAINEDGLLTLLHMEQLGYNKILFFDDRGRYILSTTLSNKELINDLHNYADGKNGLIYYYNICLFHKEDTDIAETLIQNESGRLSL